MHDSLRFLDLSHNLISLFPSQFLIFPKLQTLLLDHNRISSFASFPTCAYVKFDILGSFRIAPKTPKPH